MHKFAPFIIILFPRPQLFANTKLLKESKFLSVDYIHNQRISNCDNEIQGKNDQNE